MADNNDNHDNSNNSNDDDNNNCIPKLFLTSSGVVNSRMRAAWDQAYEQAKEATGYSKIVYIPDAATMEDGHHGGVERHAEQYARSLMRQLGVEDRATVEILIASQVQPQERQGDSSSSVASALDHAAAVYVEMGNTYFVTYHIRRSGLDDAIQRLMARGGLYAGASAGAILAGATLRICEWKNWDDPGHGTTWDLRTTKWGLDGLSLIEGGASIFPHAGPQWNQLVNRMKSKHKEQVIILDEDHCWVQDDSGGRLV